MIVFLFGTLKPVNVFLFGTLSDRKNTILRCEKSVPSAGFVSTFGGATVAEFSPIQSY